jgi:hypothetical protein
MKQQKWNKAKRWFARLGGGGVIVLCLAAGGFWYWINIPPQIKIPTPVMPHPNGYDYFGLAAKAFVLDDKGVDEITDTHFIPGKPKKYPLAAKEAWLKKNTKAFHLLREGLKYPALHPPIRSFSNKGYPNYAQFRNMARALEIESHAHAERGDWNGAVQSVLVDYHFGNQVARGAPLIAGLVSISIRAMSLRELGNLVPHTDATIAKMAASNMEKIYDQRYTFYKNVQEEKWVNIAAMLEVMRNPPQMNISSWRMWIIHSSDIPIADYPKIFVTSKRKFIHDLTKLAAETIENAQRPYVKQRPITASGDPLANAILPGFRRPRWNWARSGTQSVEVMTMYALRAYKLDNGHYPKNLKALVPTYLRKVPIDPFDGFAPLHYQLQGEKYLLWSNGSDGVDDHGTPITNPYATGPSQSMSNRVRYNFLSPDSKGDVVAGINMP